MCAAAHTASPHDIQLRTASPLVMRRQGGGGHDRRTPAAPGHARPQPSPAPPSYIHGDASSRPLNPFPQRFRDSLTPHTFPRVLPPIVLPLHIRVTDIIFFSPPHQVGHDADHFSDPEPAGTSKDREHSIRVGGGRDVSGGVLVGVVCARLGVWPGEGVVRQGQGALHSSGLGGLGVVCCWIGVCAGEGVGRQGQGALRTSGCRGRVGQGLTWCTTGRHD